MRKLFEKMLRITYNLCINLLASFCFAVMITLCAVVIIADRLSTLFSWLACKFCGMIRSKRISIVERCYNEVMEWKRKKVV
jgi:hypothetical protein